MDQSAIRVIARDSLVFFFSILFWVFVGFAFAGDNAIIVIFIFPVPTYLAFRLILWISQASGKNKSR